MFLSIIFRIPRVRGFVLDLTLNAILKLFPRPVFSAAAAIFGSLWTLYVTMNAFYGAQIANDFCMTAFCMAQITNDEGAKFFAVMLSTIAVTMNAFYTARISIDIFIPFFARPK